MTKPEIKLLTVVDKCEVWALAGGAVAWTDDAAIDTDGCGPLHGDPYAQPDTSLHIEGEPLNADIDRYIVVPPQIIAAVQSRVIGCQGFVEYKGRRINVVVGDVGPRRKIGEMSVATAKALGIPWSPIHGGTDDKSVRYVIYPGQMADRHYFRSVQPLSQLASTTRPWWKFWA